VSRIPISNWYSQTHHVMGLVGCVNGHLCDKWIQERYGHRVLVQ